VPAEQQDYHQQHSAESSLVLLHKSEPDASSSSYGCEDLQIFQLAFVPGPVIKEGEENSPSYFIPLFAQVTSPLSCPMNTEAGNSSMPKLETDHLNLDTLMLAQMASTQVERAVFLLAEEEGV